MIVSGSGVDVVAGTGALASDYVDNKCGGCGLTKCIFSSNVFSYLLF